MDAATITLYSCRSLEHLVFQHTVRFEYGRDGVQPTAEESDRVCSIVAEADNPDYYSMVARDGNRLGHYRSPCLGATLVHPLVMSPVKGASPRGALKERGVQELDDRHRLLEAIKTFEARVEAALPGTYTFFSHKSLHITLRALMM